MASKRTQQMYMDTKPLADALPQFFSQADVARALGISKTGVKGIERSALHKIAVRLKASIQHEQQ